MYRAVYRYSDIDRLKSNFELEKNKDNIGKYYKVIISSTLDSDNKLEFPFDNTRQIQKTTLFGKRKIVVERFRDKVATNIYAEKKSDGIYEVFTGKKVEALPTLCEKTKTNDSSFYCFRVDELTTREELFQMNEDLEKISRVPKDTVKFKLSEESKRISDFCIIASLMEATTTKMAAKANLAAARYDFGTPPDVKVKKIGTYPGPYKNKNNRYIPWTIQK